MTTCKICGKEFENYSDNTNCKDVCSTCCFTGKCFGCEDE
jgi:hypothetical protein